MQRMKRLIMIPLLLLSIGVFGQSRSAIYHSYIRKYSPWAVEQMNKYNIPASITLSQGLLESGAGTSQLARYSNNHFGIKCGRGWSGKKVYHDDDYRNECFRAYRTAKESYEDHSLFLTRNARYASLFHLRITDYRGWAKGLKKAGYATDPSYANRLITIIEDYGLYKYDRLKGYKSGWEEDSWALNPHDVHLCNNIVYVIARDGDTFRSIGKEFGISWRKLVKYNDLQKDYTLMPGDIVYLKKKKKRAADPMMAYVIKEGDSMHSISQMFGIRLKSLYKMNLKSPDYVPEVGEPLRLQ